MMVRIAACFLLAGCTVQQTVTPAEVPEQTPKPAIRARVVPGTTLGNVPLQQQTLSHLKGPAIQQVNRVLCDPSAVLVTDTNLLDEPMQSEYNLSLAIWEELWTLDVCGEPVDIEVRYMKHASGIIHISARRSEWTTARSSPAR